MYVPPNYLKSFSLLNICEGLSDGSSWVLDRVLQLGLQKPCRTAYGTRTWPGGLAGSLPSLDRYAISLLTLRDLILPVSSPFELFLSIALSPPSIVLRFYRLHGWSSGTVPF
jgi:hypothetical protein